MQYSRLLEVLKVVIQQLLVENLYTVAQPSSWSCTLSTKEVVMRKWSKPRSQWIYCLEGNAGTILIDQKYEKKMEVVIVSGTNSHFAC